MKRIKAIILLFFSFFLLVCCFLWQTKEEELSAAAYTETAEADASLISILDIYNEEDFLTFADSVNRGNKYIGEYVNLHADLDFTGISASAVVGRTDNSQCRFQGIFDGNGHCINHLELSSEEAGLFLNLAGTVCNLTIASGSLSGTVCGGIAPSLLDEAWILNCASYAEVEGDSFDGVRGQEKGIVQNCTSLLKESTLEELNQGLGGLSGLRGMEDVDAWYLWKIEDSHPFLTQVEANVLRSVTVTIPVGNQKLGLSGFYSSSGDAWCLALPTGVDAWEGEAIAQFQDGSRMELPVSDQERETSFEESEISYRLLILSGKAAPSLFLLTDTQDALRELHIDKDRSVQGSCFLMEADGSVTEERFKKLKGHGNDSWDALKKSYNLTFEEQTNLLDMGAGRKYTLLAGYRDNSLLAYKITNDMALEIGMDYAQQTEFVHLYVDGTYLGVYFLTGKIEIGTSRFNLKDMEKLTSRMNLKGLEEYERGSWKDEATGEERYWSNLDRVPSDVTGGWILEYDKLDYDPDQARFVSTRGTSIVPRSMPYASREQIDYIADFWQDFEDALYAGDGYNDKGKYYMDYIDAASFADQWLFYEFCTDNSLDSSIYFYKESDECGDGRIHAVYPWDMEHALTRGNVDSSWLVNVRRDGYWTYLYRHEDFAELVYEEWTEKFLPAIEKALDEESGKNPNGIGSLKWYETFYGEDMELNNLRWSSSNYQQKLERVKMIYTERSAFLTKALGLWDLGYLGFDEEDGIKYAITKDGEWEMFPWSDN